MTRDVRTELRRLMLATLADERAHHDWTYHAVRPMVVPAAWHPGLHVVGDCSKGVQYLCRWAGAPDPMRNGWATWGNSSTLALQLRHVGRVEQLQVGDPITFGRWGSEHAAMVLEPGSDPLLWSFGHPGAPNVYRLSADRRERQLLHLPVAPAAMSPAAALRAHRGYWSWLAWWLGEGDWRRHSPRDPAVRPSVPRLIPPAWWAGLALFLKNRHRGDRATTALIPPAALPDELALERAAILAELTGPA